MTREEQRQEMKEINARLKALKHTRPKLIAKCREIMASSNLTDAEKADAVINEAIRYLDDNSHKFLEMRTVNDLMRAMEDEHTGTRERPTYCPTCGTWAPSAPPGMDALEEEWGKTKEVLVKKVAAAILKAHKGRKAA
jgi:hypothetical protein